MANKLLTGSNYAVNAVSNYQHNIYTEIFRIVLVGAIKLANHGYSIHLATEKIVSKQECLPLELNDMLHWETI